MLQHVLVPLEDFLLLRVQYHNLFDIGCQLHLAKPFAHIISRAHSGCYICVVCLRCCQRPKLQEKWVCVLKQSLLEKQLLYFFIAALSLVQQPQQRVCNDVCLASYILQLHSVFLQEQPLGEHTVASVLAES